MTEAGTGGGGGIGIIPVRSGSIGVPGKNLRALAGKPLLWYTIRAAQEARRLSSVVVSVDGDELAAFASSLGAIVLRHPPQLSTDESPTFPVIQWALQTLREAGHDPAFCCVLRATSPLRTADDVDAAVDLLLEHPDADSVVSVGPAVGVHPMRLKHITPDGRLRDAFAPEGFYPRRRQELERPPLYVRNGGIYVARPHVIAAGGLWGRHCLAFCMPEDRSMNINTEFQFKVCELLLTRSSATALSPVGLDATAAV